MERRSEDEDYQNLIFAVFEDQFLYVRVSLCKRFVIFSLSSLKGER